MYVRLGLLHKRKAGKPRKEKGASLVLISIMIPVFIGLAAVSIDYAVYSDTKRRLQNGTDAAALAMAKFCAENNTAKCSPGAGNSEATWYVNENMPGATATVSPAANPAAGEITVTGTAQHSNMFARIFGDSTATATAESTARWGGSIIRAEVKLPVMAGYCDWQDNKPQPNGDPGNLIELKWSGPSVPSLTIPPGRNFVANNCTGLGTTTAAQAVRWGNTPNRALYSKPSAIDWFGTPSNCRLKPEVGGFFDGLDLESALVGGRFSNMFQSGCGSRSATLAVGEVIPMPLYATRVRNYGIWPNANVKVPGRSGNAFDLISVANAMGTTRIVGFAPFKIEAFYEETTTGTRQGWVNNCTMRPDMLFGWFLSSINPSCAGFRGRFVKTATPIPGAEYGYSADGSMGAVEVKLSK